MYVDRGSESVSGTVSGGVVKDPPTVLDVIGRRRRVLQAVDTEGAEKRQLVSDLDVSRSTIDRAVRELESNGLVERTPDGIERTLAGRLALEEYDAFANRIEGLTGVLDVLEPLPADADLDAVVFDGATTVRAEPYSPHRPITELCDLLDRATSVRSIVVAVFPRQVDAYVDLVRADADVELFLSPGVAERLVADHGDELSSALATGRLAVRRADDEQRFGLLHAETPTGPVAGLLLVGDAGARAFVRNDSPEAADWARDRFEALWTEGEPFRTDGDDSS